YGKNVPTVPLSLFLFNVGKWHDTVWQERKRFLNPYMAFEEMLIGDVFGMGEVGVRYTGSFRVGLQPLGMSGSDNDMMYIYKSIRVNIPRHASSADHLTMQKSEFPGHVYLQLNVPKSSFIKLYQKIALSVQVDNFGFPIADEIGKILDQSGLQKLGEGFNGCFLSSEVFTALHSRFNYFRFGGWVTFQQTGPATTISWNMSTLPNYVNIGSLDNVFALHCPSWPVQASRWFSRERNFDFPSAHVIKAIMNYGVDLVPKPRTADSPFLANSSCRTKFLWRLSFSIPELLLVNSWNDAQRICYRYAKTLLRTNLGRLGISSYCVLNIMLGLIEETHSSQWIDRHLVLCLQMILDKLEKCCSDGVCAHYFVPENNLFSEIPRDKLLKGSRMCKQTRDELYAHIWLNKGIWCYLKGVRQTNWAPFDIPAVFYGISDERSLGDFLTMCPGVLSDLQKRCERNYRIYYCLKVYRELARSWYASEQYPQRKEFILKAMRTFLQVSSRAHAKEEEFIISTLRFAYFKCLRAYLHEVDSRSEWHLFHQKELIRLRQTALSCQDDSQSNVVVALENYLDGNFEAAATILENGSSLGERYDNSSRTFPIFSAFDKNSVDRHIRDFSFKGHAFYCPEIIVRWYVLWQCYLALGKDEELVASAQRKLKELDLGNLYQENFRIMKPLFEPFGRYLQNAALD
ncbi:hypothetical protein ACROYT_G041840, partial [Oculina patagonica]